MDLQKKLGYVRANIQSVSTHRDVDAAVRKHALGLIKEMIVTEEQAIDAEIAAQVETLLPASSS